MIVDDSSGELEVADELVLTEAEPQPKVAVQKPGTLADQWDSVSKKETEDDFQGKFPFMSLIFLRRSVSSGSDRQ